MPVMPEIPDDPDYDGPDDDYYQRVLERQAFMPHPHELAETWRQYPGIHPEF